MPRPSLRRPESRLLAPAVVSLGAWVVMVAGCGGNPAANDDETTTEAPTETVEPTGTEDATDTGGTETVADLPEEPIEPFDRRVFVYVDGEPTAHAVVIQGGAGEHYVTGDDGSVVVTIDTSVVGDWALMGSQPEARTGFAIADPADEADLIIELTRYVTGDNEDYTFLDPGVPLPPGDDGDPYGCAHCHRTLNAQWYDSPHRRSASNATVQDLYAGVAAAIDEQAQCELAGGQWWEGLEPGTGEAKDRCYLGDGALPDLNADCGVGSSCDGVAENYGGCADCHAPAINGQLGGRDLLEAREYEYEFGVHCDMCHKVESLDLDAPPGVGGRLMLARPFEDGGIGDEYKMIQFGPYHDVGFPRMGAVQRDFFAEAEFCAGCHQQDMGVDPLVGAIDLERWPDGALPIHSTYEEWLASPMAPDAPCGSCHMPPDLNVTNSADLQYYEALDIGIMPGINVGWRRQPGTVRAHSFIGPRTPESGMLQQAALLTVDTNLEGDLLTAEVKVRNSGAGHALPTGEPMRSMLLLVEASCDGERLVQSDGPVVPDFGGWLDRKEAPEDWSVWPGAEVGEIIRVVTRSGDWYDPTGPGPFGDGTFTAEEKGMPVEWTAGEATIVDVQGDTVQFDVPLPEGDIAYRLESPVPVSTLGADDIDLDAAIGASAAATGFAFARLLVGADGRRMVPHFVGIDVASDNRILPQETWAGEFSFTSICDEPVVHAALIHRPYGIRMARERLWPLGQAVMAFAQH